MFGNQSSPANELKFLNTEPLYNPRMPIAYIFSGKQNLKSFYLATNGKKKQSVESRLRKADEEVSQ